jgi:hypothetical protein
MAKKLKLKVPKRVAGIKIPKSIRKGPVADFLNSPAGQIVVAEALVIAAGAFTASRTDTDVHDLLRHPVENAERAGHAMAATGADQVSRVSFALKEASRAFRAAMEDGERLPERASRSGSATVETDRVAKKKQSSQVETTAH